MEAWWARFSEMMYLCGPPSWKTLLASSADVEEARRCVADAGRDAADVLDARRLLAATIHPDTDQPIPLPFRMAAHVPVNALLLLGMLSARGPLANGFWQFANQSFNAAQFYANRNGSNTVTDTQLLASYAGATASAVAVAAGLSTYFGRLLAAASAAGRAPGFALRFGSAAVPFLGAAAGKPLQIGLMRSDEWTQGVEVSDASGRVLGRSVLAGREAVLLTIITRTTYLAPMLWLPWAQAALERAVPFLARNPRAAAVSYALHCGVNSAFVTPACIALFDQRTSLPVSSLEEQYRGLVDPSTGAPVERLYFNKGL